MRSVGPSVNANVARLNVVKPPTKLKIKRPMIQRPSISMPRQKRMIY